MAKTQGHGNPDWSKDETILALDLYLDFAGGPMPEGEHPRVVELSKLLRALPVHPPERRGASFRNPDGVSFKLQNLRSVASGRGLSNASKTDRQVWTDFGGDRPRVSELAAQIASAVESSAEPAPTSITEVDVDVEFAEGRILTVRHARRERKPALRKALLARRRKVGALACDACGYKSGAIEPAVADAAFEAHHLVPLAWAGDSITKVADTALLCATCHRMVHRAISISRQWLGMEGIRKLVGR